MGLVLAACGDNTATVPAQSIATAPASAKNQPAVKVAVGSTAPDFTAKDINGQTIQLSSLRGKAVLVNFWSVY
jgi:cytochrome oxidase Cu insertion factor (SCO1/SenC/PrrC family)